MRLAQSTESVSAETRPMMLYSGLITSTPTPEVILPSGRLSMTAAIRLAWVSSEPLGAPVEPVV